MDARIKNTRGHAAEQDAEGSKPEANSRAERLQVDQGSVSKLEGRTDVSLSIRGNTSRPWGHPGAARRLPGWIDQHRPPCHAVGRTQCSGSGSAGNRYGPDFERGREVFQPNSASFVSSA